MTRLDLGSAILAGALGTAAMTVLMYAAPLMGLPPMDLLGALGSVVPLPVSPYMAGGLMHLAIGVVLAVIYAVIFERVLPGPRWARGAMFALLPWLFAITLMGPMMAWVQTTVGRAEASSVANPCAIRAPAANPCAATAPKPGNPCAASAGAAGAPSPWLLRTMSLMAHLMYGGVVAMTYRRREPS